MSTLNNIYSNISSTGPVFVSTTVSSNVGYNQGGVSVQNLVERLALIEKMLNIPDRNLYLESKYPKIEKAWRSFTAVAIESDLAEVKKQKEIYLELVRQYLTWDSVNEK